METQHTTVIETEHEPVAEVLTCMVCSSPFPSTRTFEELDDIIPVCTDACRRILSARLTTLRNITEI